MNRNLHDKVKKTFALETAHDLHQEDPSFEAVDFALSQADENVDSHQLSRKRVLVNDVGLSSSPKRPRFDGACFSPLNRDDRNIAEIDGPVAVDAALPSTRGQARYFHAKPLLDHVECTGLHGRRIFMVKSFAPSHAPFNARSLQATSVTLRQCTDVSSAVDQRNLVKEFQELLDDIDVERVREAEARFTRVASNPSLGLSLLQRRNQETSIASDSVDPNQFDTDLWVVKYAPRTFSELLSDERTNRDVLSWLNSFKRLSSARKPSSAMTRPAATDGTHQLLPNRVASDDMTDDEDGASHGTEPKVGHFNRPAGSRRDNPSSLILISGPAGIGKTTMAHVLASHAGYEPLELNASDERARDLVVQRVSDAANMKSLGVGGKRVCVILDECDGLTRQAVDGIVEFLRRGLVCPIIAVCNDVYAPVLRPFRAVSAGMYSVRPPSHDRLVRRLRMIAVKEKIRWESQVFSAIVEAADGDIRSCLHTMQFLHRNHKELTMKQYRSLQGIVGSKDMDERNLFRCYESVFVRSAAVSNVKKRLHTGSTFEIKKLESADAIPFNLLLSLVGDDVEKVVDGCFVNMWFSRFHDPKMGKAAAALDYVTEFDFLTAHNFGMREYYQGWQVDAFHQFCSGNLPLSATIYPKVFAETWKTVQKHSSYLHDITSVLLRPITKEENEGEKGNAVPVIVSSICSRATTWVPLVNRILYPIIRNTSFSLMTAAEKELLSRIVDICATYGISFRSSSQDSQPCLDPPLHLFAPKTLSVPAIPPHLARYIAHEANLETVRRLATSRQSRRPGAKGTETTQNLPPKRLSIVPNSTAQLATATKTVSSSLLTFLSTTRKSADDNCYRGRMKHTGATNQAERQHSMVVYKHQEGYTNAVKKPLKMWDLL